MTETGTNGSAIWPVAAPSVESALRIAERWEELPGERRMVANLLRWLSGVRWLGSASRVAFEVPWRGRRIDLVTTNGRGHVSTFEFKLGGTRRVFEQALYNSASAHRSTIVLGARPSPGYRTLAQAHGLGVIAISGAVELVQRPAMQRPESVLARSLRAQALARAGRDV